MYISAIDPAKGMPTRLQQYLPPAPVDLRQFPLHTVYEPSSKLFMTFGINYPGPGKMTAWSSLVSGTDYSSVRYLFLILCVLCSEKNLIFKF